MKCRMLKRNRDGSGPRGNGTGGRGRGSCGRGRN